MKKFIFTLCFVTTILLGFSCAQKAPAGKYIIEGQLSNIEDGTVVRLMKHEGQIMVTMNFDTLKDGKFRFENDAPSSPEKLAIRCDDFFSWADVWVCDGVVATVKGSNKYMTTWVVSSTIAQQKEINGYKKINRELELKRWELKNEANKIMLSAEGAPDIEKLESECDSIELVVDKIMLDIRANNLKVLKNGAATEVWLDLFKQTAFGLSYAPKDDDKVKSLIIEASEMFNNLTEEVKRSDVGQQIKIYLFPVETVKTGDHFADGVLYDLDGNVHSISEFKGKYILLDFWSRGCGPCIMAFPEIKELCAEFTDQVAFISISSDNENMWREGSEEHKLTWNNFNDLKGDTGIHAKYDIRGIPYYVIISPEGIIAETWMGYRKGLLRSKIDQYVK